MLTKNDTRKFIRNALRVLPAIPVIRMIRPKRRAAPVVSIVLGVFGVAVVGGLAAVMALSPRTRRRALGMAKDAYGKLDATGIPGRLGIRRAPLANGFGERTGSDYASGL